jgi:hypothetical protein
MPGAFPLTQGIAPLPACLQCSTDFPAPAARRGKVQVYCSRPCQTKAANARRASTRQGRVEGITYPRGNGSGRPPASALPDAPDSSQTPASGHASVAESVDRARLEELMDKAHSRVGVTSFEIAMIAKLRGISAWAPLRVIIAREGPRK